MAADRVIRWTTAGAIVGVAAMASCEHAYALVRARDVRLAVCEYVQPVRLGCRWPHQLNCAEVLVLAGHGRGRSSPQVRRRSGPFSGSTGGKRRPDPHGPGSLRPSFSTSSVSMRTTRSPRLTLDSLEGTPGGACWSAQKDASPSRSRYMASSCRNERQNRSEHGRQVPANISGHSTALDKQQLRTTRGKSGHFAQSW